MEATGHLPLFYARMKPRILTILAWAMALSPLILLRSAISCSPKDCVHSPDSFQGFNWTVHEGFQSQQNEPNEEMMDTLQTAASGRRVHTQQGAGEAGKGELCSSAAPSHPLSPAHT